MVIVYVDKKTLKQVAVESDDTIPVTLEPGETLGKIQMLNGSVSCKIIGPVQTLEEKYGADVIDAAKAAKVESPALMTLLVKRGVLPSELR